MFRSKAIKEGSVRSKPYVWWIQTPVADYFRRPANLMASLIAAKIELEELAKDGTILYEQFYDRTYRKKDR